MTLPQPQALPNDPASGVAAHSVGLRYPSGTVALENVTFTIPRGQFVSVVGPSGCGKSSLLRAIAGLVRVTSGSIKLFGAPPAEARAGAHRISFVFQDPTLLAWRRVSDNVRLPLELARTGREADERISRRQAEDRVAEALEMVGLTQFRRGYPSELSGGMRMRASLARAIVTDPDVLLMDEPFGALDDISRQRLNDELHALWRMRGWTALFVTHNIGEAAFLSQRILVLSPRPGRLAADIAVPFGTERTAELRETAEFARFVGKVSAQLREFVA